ncbi:MAG: GDSL-type esterase/lipase family protein [Clostridiales bacterium]|jgi:lysophospholipase L1-like esterase|nr:GDSL-type esterase/lipase family protein [Clostridiales bacterium]
MRKSKGGAAVLLFVSFVLFILAVSGCARAVLRVRADEYRQKYQGGAPLLVALGDSITNGHGLPYGLELGAVAARECGFSYSNNAQSGAATYDLLDRLCGGPTALDAGDADAYVSDRTPKDVAAADYIVLSVGGNDFLADKARFLETLLKTAAGNTSVLEETLARAAKGFSDCLKKIRALNARAPVIVLTNYAPQTAHKRVVEGLPDGVPKAGAMLFALMDQAMSGTPDGRVVGFNRRCRDIAADIPAVYFADTKALIDGRPELMQDEPFPVHPNADGHAAIGRLVADAIKDAIKLTF